MVNDAVERFGDDLAPGHASMRNSEDVQSLTEDTALVSDLLQDKLTDHQQLLQSNGNSHGAETADILPGQGMAPEAAQVPSSRPSRPETLMRTFQTLSSGSASPKQQHDRDSYA